MATTVYESSTVNIVGGGQIEVIPLKIKYLREFMIAFGDIKDTTTDDEVLSVLINCARISMKQYMPELSNSVSDIEESFTIDSLYDIIYASSGIDVRGKKDAPEKAKADTGNQTWDNLDLASLEAEVFLLGIWKDYQELELSLSMPELSATLDSKREAEQMERRFLASIQGIDLDSEDGDGEVKGQKEWDDMKARVFSGGKTGDSSDVLSLQGPKAAQAGFGINMGLDYSDDRDPTLMI